MNSLIFRTRVLGVFSALLLVLVTAFLTIIVIYFAKREEVLRSVPIYEAHVALYDKPEALDAFLEQEGYIRPSLNQVQKVEAKGEFLLLDPVIRSAFHSGHIQMYVYEHFHYYKFMIHDEEFWVKNMKPASHYVLYVMAAFTLLLLMLFLMYRYIDRSIYPLRWLHSEIVRFSNGEKNINTHSDKKDEVAMVGNAFHEAVQTIEQLQDGRALLLRTIMHELNTPLTRGRILTPMLSAHDDDKALLANIFLQMQQHVKKLQEVDAITSKGLILNKRPYALIDIIDEISDILGVEKGLSHNISQEQVLVDFTLFTSALQNLIQNALKYAQDCEAKVCMRGNRLFIMNKAAPLKEDFFSYTIAFKRESEDALGMGLGLFVTQGIVHAHGFKLGYRYYKGQHFVWIDMRPTS